MEVLQKHKLRLLFESVEVEHQNRVYLELARAKHIDGMILLISSIDEAGHRMLSQVEVPAVLTGELTGTNLYSVDIDNRRAAYNAVRYLLMLGHMQIGCITYASKSHRAAYDRLLGYKDALASVGIRFDDRLLRYADFDSHSGYLQMKSILAGKAFSAVFVASDNVAMGARAALHEAGLCVREDISVVGFGDIPWAPFSDPPLTTIRLPAFGLGWAGGERLIRLIRGEGLDRGDVLLNSELVVRKSSFENFRSN